MKITHIYKDYYPVFGGIENYIRVLAEAQASHGHDVTVLVNSLSNRPEISTVNGVRLIKAARHLDVQSAPISATFPSLVSRHTTKADIVHLHAPYPIGEACNLWFGRGKRTVISWHSDIVRQKSLLRVYAPVLRQVITRADRIIPASEAYARSSIWLRDRLDKCRIVPYGIDAERFKDQRSEAAESLRQRLLAPFLPAQPLLLIGVGRLRYYKGFDDVIRAVAQLPHVVAVIAGIGPMAAELKALAAQLQVSDRIIFPGEPTDAELPLYLQAADAYAMPSTSRAESFGIATLEAMSCGLPAITTEIGTATSWINQDGVTGFVVPPLNPPALAGAIEKMQDATQRQRMSQAARARVLQEFTWQKMVERVQQVYQEISPH